MPVEASDQPDRLTSVHSSPPVQARNKPKEAPKAPEQAPFFLPSLNAAAQEKRLGLGEVDGDGVQDDDVDKARKKRESHRLIEFGMAMETEFTRRLSSENIDGDCELPPLLSLPASSA